MKKILFLLLIIFPVYLVARLAALDKKNFLWPVQYSRDLVIRNDSRGDGGFSAKRNGRRIHEGLDLLAPIGTPVLAARSGRVVLSRTIYDKNKKTGSGNYIIIWHPGNVTTIYAHLSAVYVKGNDLVRQGQLIGAVGKTGNANFSDIMPHLHFEVRLNGVPQDPMEYLE